MMRSTIGASVFIALMALQSVTSRSTGSKVNTADNQHVCSYSQADGILKADCKALQLNSVPDDLKPDIKVLDLRQNGIQTGDFSSYPQLQTLLLDGNQVESIESLQGLTNLQELSLRSNAIQKVSPSLVKRLPNLRRLDLSENDLVEPLGAANLIAPLCDLQELILEKTEKALDFCDCVVLQSWVDDGLQVSPPAALQCKNRLGWVMDGEVTCLRAMPEVPEAARAQCRDRQGASARAADGSARESESKSKKQPWWVWFLVALGCLIVLMAAGFIINCFCNCVVCCAGCVCCAACKGCKKCCECLFCC